MKKAVVLLSIVVIVLVAYIVMSSRQSQEPVASPSSPQKSDASSVPSYNTEDAQQLLDAARNGRQSDVEALLDKGVAPDVKDSDGRTPVHLAVIGGHQTTAGILLDHGADVNAKDNEGRTPLNLAREHGHAQLAEFLSSKGAKDEGASTGAVKNVAGKGGSDAKVSTKVSRGLKPSLKFKTIEEFQTQIKEPALLLEDRNVCFFVPKRREQEARIIFPYLTEAYNELYRIVGVDTEYKMAIYAFPKGDPNGWGGTSNCSIEYDDANLDLASQQEWQKYKVPHVSGYIEEMAHNFAHATGSQFGWEMVGWSIGAKVTRRIADNPIFEEALRGTRIGQYETYTRYIQNQFTLPADIPANQCDRIHAWILYQCEQDYGPNFWRDFFAEMRKQSQALKDAASTSGGDNAERNARYRITIDCFDRLPRIGFKQRLQSAGISLVTDVKSLKPESTGWNRRLTE